MEDVASELEKFQRTIASFSEVADFYYQKSGDYFRNPEHFDYVLLRRFVNRLFEGARVLDAGCGPGGASSVLADNGCVVTGIDLAAGMVTEAARNCPKAKFAKMDLRDLEFSSGEFDAVCCFYTLYVLPSEDDVLDALDELTRVLCSDGLLAISIAESREGDLQMFEKWKPPDRDEPFLTYFKLYPASFIIPELQKRGFSVEFEASWHDKNYDQLFDHKYFVMKKCHE